MKAQREQQVKETTRRAAMYWLKAQVAEGKTESEIKAAFELPETKEAIKQSANRLMN